MKKGSAYMKKLWQDLDRIVIRERIEAQTAVCDGRNNSARMHKTQWELHFSLQKLITVAAAAMALAAGGMLLWKKCVESKLVSRLRKKYFLLPLDQVPKEAKEQD